MTYEAGELLMFETGDYADFRVVGVMRATRAFDIKELEARFRLQFRPQWASEEPDAGSFVDFLMAEGVVEEAKLRKVFLGAYSLKIGD
jgi:hypothetical protein